MRILMTGHDGYIGSVMGKILSDAGHEVAGLDAGFFEGCSLGDYNRTSVFGHRGDVRDVTAEALVGFDAVVHLAALSNDPLGNLDPDLTYEINHRASVGLARRARAAGVERFVFASSCSLYGVQGEDVLDETAGFHPITPYGETKVLAERDISALADDDFSPTFMRNATVYGAAPRLRCDVVVNNLLGHAFTTGEVLILSDGTPWRPLVHVRDVSKAFLAVLEAPRDRVHDEAFNVGRTEENYRVSDVAEVVKDAVPGSRVRYAGDGGPDPRSYRVDCGKIADTLPGFEPTWTVEKGVEELRDAFEAHGLTEDEFEGDRYFRLRRIRTLLDEGRLDGELRWSESTAAVGGRS